MSKSNEVEPIKKVKDIAKVKQYILEKDNKRGYCVFVVGINIGLLAGDLLSLKICDVTDGKTIFDEVSITEQKTGKFKTFTLNKSAKDSIQLYLNTFHVVDLDGWLFPSRKGCHIGVRPLHHIIKTTLRELGVKGNYGTHTLRKTIAFHRYQNNVPIETLQKLLNHSSSATTLRYIGITKEVITDCYNAINL